MNTVKPTGPVTGRILRNEPCTARKKAAGFVHHIDIDVSGTPLAGNCRSGQAFGVVAPGEDERGRSHKPRLYSLASPTQGEDGSGNVISTTVKRTVDEHWETGKLFLGVASNYLCDLEVGDEVQVCGPNGKRFLLPTEPEQHDYLFFATGTGIAPFRGMVKELLEANVDSRVTLVMGTPYATDLLYHDMFKELESKHENFSYLTAVSRGAQEDGGIKPMYVQDRMAANADELGDQLNSERNLIYICGIAGMEVGIFQQLAKQLSPEQVANYLTIDPEVADNIEGWERKMIPKKIHPTKRVMMEVYA
ncbi:MAG: hypothetical protein AAGB34_02745 [Planctomycetota bacterium]